MRQAVSIRDVAARAGVSVGTVSNVLNHAHLVRAETQSRVLEAIEELGFVRSEAARQLRAGHSRMIGLLVLDVTNPFFTDVARAVVQSVGATGLSVMLCDSDNDADKQHGYLTQLAEQRVQGVLIVPVGPPNAAVASLRKRGIPVVLLDTRSTDRSVCSVSIDDVGGGEKAVAHLLDCGHHRIMFVGGGRPERQVVDRAKGAAKAMVKAGLDPADLAHIEVPALNVAGGREAGRAIMALPARKRPTAAFCSNDLLALGLLQELTRVGAAVPDDLALIGYDDISFAAAAAVPLSSIRQPRHELGQWGARLLLEEVSGEEHEHQRVVLDTQLVVRESSGALHAERSLAHG